MSSRSTPFPALTFLRWSFKVVRPRENRLALAESPEDLAFWNGITHFILKKKIFHKKFHFDGLNHQDI
jgi:hypothetical protein